MKKLKSIAHIRIDDDKIQTVEEHLHEARKLAEIYGEKVGVKHIAGLAGLLHDLGKYSSEFSNYIMKAVYEPEHAPSRGSVDHSTAGGKLLYELLHEGDTSNVYSKVLAEIVGNTIISHHSYLHDFLSPDLTSPYLKRVRDKELHEFPLTKEAFFRRVMSKKDFQNYLDHALEELQQFIQKTSLENREAELMFLSKYIFSALIDADRTNTREFIENSSEANDNDNRASLFNTYYSKLMERLHRFSENPEANNPINVLRSSMSEQCEKFAQHPSGIYTLSIPTGGGKTLASLRYALKHAEKYSKKRIIYIVPYTTIIEQNAADVRSILGKDSFILEHHSNVVESDYTNEEDLYHPDIEKKLMLAKDNWDAPIIFTTMVQFLNVFYAHGSRNVRRLHNLAESILIFDEVQKVPVNCISLFNESLNFLKKFCQSSIILCTATQPALDFVNKKLDIERDAEIIENIDEVVNAFKRVEIIDKASGEQFDQEKLLNFIGEKLKNTANILVILNTKKAVADLYKALKDSYKRIPIYHLSTSMCPTHRTNILNNVREHLEKQQPVICVSTQLIEAGVDISFECVIRSLAGLDSIAQAAGRCNRHGEKDLKNVYVIDYIEENLTYLHEIAQGKRIAKTIFKDLQINPQSHGNSILSMQAMTYYFQHFYKENEVNLDYPIKGMNQSLVELLMANYHENSLLKDYLSRNTAPPLILNNSYQTAAKNFQVIDSPTTSIIVPYEDGKDIIADLNGEMHIDDLSQLFHKAQRFTVNVYPYQLDLLKENGSLTTLFDDQIYALKEIAYDEEYGINIEGDSKQQFLAF